MDQRLISWGAKVKARHRGHIPPLWFFTDLSRLPDPRAVVAALPKGLCGVVLRHDTAPDRAALGRDLARLCRQRRNLLVVAGDAGLALQLRAGLHLRGGKLPGKRAAARGVLITSSAHNQTEVVRAVRAGAGAIFVSPLFATQSHPGARPLGVIRWLRLSAHVPAARLALGGIGPAELHRVPLRRVSGLGAIGAFLED
jgi:thiamine-phosphate pyrophosphorylase